MENTVSSISQAIAALPFGWFAKADQNEFRYIVDFTRADCTMIFVKMGTGDTAAEINWSAVGDVSPSTAAEFAQALKVAAEFAANLTA
jgi:hypothetical protein